MSSPKTSRRIATQGFFVLGAGLLLVGLFMIGLWYTLLLPGGERRTSEHLPNAMPVSVNYPAPDLRLSDLRGGQAALKDYRGQVVLVNFWATWCPPCKAEMPALQAYYETHKNQGFVLIAVNAGDSSEEVNAFVGKAGLTFPVWLDPESVASRTFRVAGLPSSFVIDRSGQIRLAWSGAVERQTLEEYVTPLIKE